ncbi:MAG TPA: glucosaminidase domain-containing protein [Gemmataceae bacterium]|jgi:hypothetical protein
MQPISGSVGRNGTNRHADVSVVQQLINDRLAGQLPPLAVDGICGELTIGAIEEIQRRYLHMNSPDGRVDPNGATFRWLTGESAPAPQGTFPLEVIAAAKASHTKWRIPASVTLAQWALESNWGRAMPSGSNNPFGIKAVGDQPYVEARTQEVINGRSVTVTARFRKFASMNEAFDQHGRLLGTGSPYTHARTLLPDADAFADALTGVYATAPNYGAVLKDIMRSHNLYQYDR